MTNQKTEEALNDYFDALLLDESEPKEAVPSVATEKAADTPTSEATRAEKSTSSIHSEPENLDKEHKQQRSIAGSVKTQPATTTTAPNELTDTESTLANSHTSHDSRSITEQVDTSSQPSKASSSQVKPFAGSSVASPQSVSSHRAAGIQIEEAKPTPSSTISTTPIPTTPIPTTPIPTTQYEEHKLRLEKMLKQVTEVNTAVENPSPPQAESKLVSGTTSVSDLNTEIRDDLNELNPSYQPLPVISSEWLENGRPNWAQERFDILLVEVNGLQLAVPLVALGQIQAIDEKLTPLFGQSDWFMGLQETPTGRIKTVNTAKFVMPERYQDDQGYRYVVSINGLQWGLAVDSIRQPISIDPDDIRWRAKRASRPWMAGMVKDHMCVLLDIPAMGDILQKQDKNHRDSTGG